MRRPSCRLLAVASLLGAALARPAAAQQPFTRGRAVDATASVRVFSMAGSVTVVGWDRDSVHVSGTVGAGLTPYTGGTRTGYKITTYEGRQDPTSPSHVELRVPRRAQLWIKTTTAAITVRDVRGSVDLATIEGDITVAGSPGELAAESMRGSVRIGGSPGWVRAKSGTGGVTFDGTARDLALSTVSGRIASSTRFTRGRFESVRGDIELAGRLPDAAIVDVDNHAGAVTLRLGAQASAAFTVFTVSGRIVNELSAARPRQAGGSGRELAFAAGAGAARVTVRTFDGAVALRLR